MKYFLLLGGGCGFLLAFASGLLAGNEIMIALRDGAIGCFAGALMMKGFSSALVMCIRGLAHDKAKARTASSTAH